MSLENTALEADGEEFVDELKPGTKLMHGQYTIEDFLAAGGFGITYLARDSLNRQVVIKECFPGSFCRRQNHSVTPRSRAHQNELKSIVRLFSQEAMALAKANHPNIVGVHLVFEENNTAYMALDYVQGRDLLEILQEDPDSLTSDLVEGYLRKVLDAIKHIHDMGILHRDISPDNIIINDQGEPILIDFGAARESSNEQVTRMLSALRVVKDGYSPQEFYIAGSDQPPSCDLYSLAASFYHIITRELPPDSQWRLSARAAGDEDPYVSLGDKTDDYTKAFVKALDKAMATLPRERMQSADEWLQHLDGTASSVAETKPLEGATVISADGSKKSFMPILLGSTALAAAIGAGVFFMSTQESEVPATVVETNDSLAVVAPVAETASSNAPADDAAAPVVTVDTPSANEAETTVANATASPEVEFAAPAADAGEATAAAQETTSGQTPVVPDLPEVADVAVLVADLPLPAVEETTDFVVPPIIAALPNQVLAPLPRPLRDVSVSVAELEDVQPVLDTAAPDALAPAEPEAVADAESATVAEAEPVEVAAAEPSVEESTSTGVDFFVNMAKSQPDLVSARSNRTTTAPQPTQRVVASAPAAAAAAPVESAAPEVATPSGEAPTIVTQFAPILPFELSFWQPGLVVSVADNGPDWLGGNARIVSVNGQPVTSNDEIVDFIRAAGSQEDSSADQITLGVESALTGATFERPLSIAKEQIVSFENGMRFSVQEESGTWVTTVVEVPSSSSLRPGDVLLSHASTWENLDQPNSLQSMIEQEFANGTTSFTIAVSRNGELLVEAFDIASLSN